jgi:hypothetical protein
MIVARWAHEDLAPLVELDLERQVFQKGIIDDVRPFHDW